MLTNPAHHAVRRTLIAAALTVALTAGTVGAAGPAHADPAVAPKSGSVTIEGAGWGHGKGMSQYGAWGAATKGLNYKQIVAFYYPGTKLANLPNGNWLRVLISADNDKILHFRPVAGQRVRDSAGKIVNLPVAAKYRKWRVINSGGKRVLQYLTKAGKYATYANKLNPKKMWYVENRKTGTVRLAMPDGSTRAYREKLALVINSSGTRVVNYLSMENYLRSVVPAEMPASWSAEAVKAQAVAARTYAARLRSTSSSTGYDLCDTSACQVYRGANHEHSASNKAISGTKNKVLHYQGKLALTMYSSSNGGWSASGGSGYPYLKAQKDPYDGVKRNQAWSKTLSSATIQKAYPSIGTLKSVQVTVRDGDGTYGGRVEQVKITGSKGSVTVNGGSFKRKFGLKERLFKVVGGSLTTSSNSTTTTSPNQVRWQELGGAKSSIGSPTGAEESVAGGLRLKFAKADLWWSEATGSRLLTDEVRTEYNSLKGAESELGFPKTDVITTDTGTYADFQVGRITCPTGKKCVVSYG